MFSWQQGGQPVRGVLTLCHQLNVSPNKTPPKKGPLKLPFEILCSLLHDWGGLNANGEGKNKRRKGASKQEEMKIEDEKHEHLKIRCNTVQVTGAEKKEAF